MNLLILNDYGLYGGGTETRIRIFVEQLLKNGDAGEIHILQKFPITTLKKEWDRRIVFHVPKPTQTPSAVVKELIQQHTIDLVQTHNLLALEPYVLLTAKQAKIPIVWWAHDYWLLCEHRSFIDPFHASRETLCPKAEGKSCNRCMGIPAKIKRRMWKHIINRCGHAIAPSSILKNIYEHEGVMNRKWSVVIPWIDPFFLNKLPYIAKVSNNRTSTSLLLNSKRANECTNNKHVYYKNRPLAKKISKEKVLLFVGSLIEFKGAWVAAHALKNICQRFPQAKLVFVGGEQEPIDRHRKEIESICLTDGTDKNILFLGKKSKEELIELYKEADVYLCPTVCMESFGLNWAEAMACGVPVVASAIGSIPEYISDTENGVLFRPRDHDALAQSVIKLFTRPQYAQQIARAGQEYAEKNFTPERATQEIVSLYRKLYTKRKPY